MLVAQITDLHVVLPDTKAGQLMKTAPALEGAVAHLESLTRKPELVLISGDLVDAGREDEYELLAELLDPLTIPHYLIPGNHDERSAMAKVMRPHGHDYLPETGFMQYALDLGELRLVAVDTVKAGASGGLLCAERLRWLDECLAESDKPTIVMQHHPPFDTGIVAMDRIGLEGRVEEEAVIRKHPHVERVICGHLHRPIMRRFGGTIASTAPSTAHSLELDLREHGHLGVLPEPAGTHMHLWQGGALVTHQSYTGDYGEPFIVG